MQIEILVGGGVVGAAAMGFIVWWFVLRGGRHKGGASNSKLATTLRDERARSDIIINSIADGVVFVDGDGTIQLFNPGASVITGWKREDAEGLDWKSVFNFVDKKGEPMSERESPLNKALRLGQVIHDNDTNLLSKSGNSIETSFSVSPIMDNAEVKGLVGIFRDVSEERAAQNQRAEFISTASHEMRTPVAAIEGYLSLALNDRVATIDTRAKDYLLKAHASTKHLGELFQDLLTSAKAEDGRITNHPEVTEVGELMQRITSDLQFAAQKKNLGIEFMIGSNTVMNASVIDASQPSPTLGGDRVVRPLYYTLADPDRLQEVITNLFDNACKYTDQGRISLGLTGNDSIVQLYVRDTGHGIPPEDIPHLFQKFYRVDNSATRTIGGTGLGLFICRKIIELYKGRIWVESKLNEGSTFYINLPRLTTQEAEKMRDDLASSTQVAPSASTDTPKTLPTTVVKPNETDATTPVTANISSSTTS